MEQKCIWKNFILLTVSGLLALHLKHGHVQELVDEVEAAVVIRNEIFPSAP